MVYIQFPVKIAGAYCNIIADCRKAYKNFLLLLLLLRPLLLPLPLLLVV